jgi:hypothetical protein
MKKVKKISKYVMNGLAMINALIVGLSPIWNWHLEKVTDSIVVITGIIGLWLVGGKLFETPKVDELKSQEKPFKDLEE